MRYVTHGAGGPASVLTIADAPRPEPRAGEVLIEVAYAGVNRPDIAQRAGQYPPPPGASPVLGLEVSGRVVEAAPDVAWPAVGDVVCALTPGGGYAEYCVAPASSCLPLPAGVSLRDAATLPENYFTVWTNVFDRGRLKAGETLLVHGGSSGIGLAAIQLARAFGARVITTVGTPEKAAFCASLGAEPIVYRATDWEAEVARLTDGAGVDVVLDMVGGGYVQKNLRALAPLGRLVQIAFMEGSTVSVDLRPVMAKRLTITGSTLRPRTVAEKAAIAGAVRGRVWPLFASGALKPVVYAELPLERAAEAHAIMESSRHIGKIVLAVRPGA
jgi:putative PIG3 family NAD(P)H quinone oxidoreductase